VQLKDLHPNLTRSERMALAEAAGISVAYLAQLATGFKTNPPLKLCDALVKHDPRLTLDDLAVEFSQRQQKERV
jgi:hypothetical protein